jgi:hypothetical protein
MEKRTKPGTSVMHKSNAQPAHDLRLRTRLIHRLGPAQQLAQFDAGRLHKDLPREGQWREGRTAPAQARDRRTRWRRRADGDVH